MANTKYDPVRQHAGHPKKNIPGPFGPHAAKQVCLKCGGIFVRWVGKECKHGL